jgi:hypothetical protein
MGPGADRGGARGVPGALVPAAGGGAAAAGARGLADGRRRRRRRSRCGGCGARSGRSRRRCGRRPRVRVCLSVCHWVGARRNRHRKSRAVGALGRGPGLLLRFARPGVGSAPLGPCITILRISAKWGPNVLFCMPIRTACNLLVSVADECHVQLLVPRSFATGPLLPLGSPLLPVALCE